MAGRSFRSNFLTLFGANVVAQGIAFASAPLLSRVFAPEAFGVAATFMVAVQLVSSFATLRLDWQVPAAKHDRAAGSLLALGFLVLIAAVGLGQLAISLPPSFLRQTSWYQDVAALASLFGISITAVCVLQLLQSWFVRTRDLRPTSSARVVQSVVTVVASVGLGMAGFGAVGVVLGTVVGQVVGSCMLYRALTTGPSRPQLVPGAAPLVSNGITVLALIRAGAASFVSTLGLAIVVLILAHRFDAAQVGWYALMMRVLGTPIGALSTALAQSFWSQVSKTVHDGDYRSLSASYLKVTAVLVAGAVPMVAVCLAGPWFVGPAFGEQWTGAGAVLTAMAPMLVGMLVFAPTNHLFAMGRQDLQLLGDGARLMLVIASAAIAGETDLGFVPTVAVISTAALAGYLLRFLLHVRCHRELVRAVTA